MKRLRKSPAGLQLVMEISGYKPQYIFLNPCMAATSLKNMFKECMCEWPALSLCFRGSLYPDTNRDFNIVTVKLFRNCNAFLLNMIYIH